MTDKNSLPLGPRDDRSQVETGDFLAIKFNDQGLVPVFTVEAVTGKPLMQAFMNAESLALTIKTKKAHYYSRSRQELWLKGATSGQIQHVQSLHVDCDQDALCLTVVQDGDGCCHVGYKGCFFREIDLDSWDGETPPTLKMIADP